MRENILKRTTILIFMIVLSPLAFGQEICDNGIDDDGDGLIDLNDTTECSCNTVIIQPSSLIPNPSFEDTLCCPSGFSQVNCATSWIQASTATSDYYNLCGWSSSGFYPAAQTPLPGGGSGFVGIIVNHNWSEYIGSCLPTAMTAGVSYTINFYTAYSQGDSTRTFAIYGAQDCNELPWPDVNCPSDYSPDWVLLDSVEVVYNSTDGAWQLETMTFTPATDIQAIALGATCLDPSDVGNYYYFDELTIDISANFSSSIPMTGELCDVNSVMFPPGIPGAASVQWYKEGIALAGQTQDTLDPDVYGLGSYTVVVTDSLGNCYTISREVYDPFINIGNITSNPPCFGFMNGAIDFQNITGPDSLYYVTLVDGTGAIIGQDTILDNGSVSYENLSDGNYAILINGVKSCPYDSLFTLDGDAINLTTTVGDLLCYNVPTGSIIITSANSILDSVIINDSDGNMVNTPGTNAANLLPAGQYTVQVTNDNGCVGQIIVPVNEPNEMEIIFNLTHNKCHNDELGIAVVDTVYYYGGDFDDIAYIWTPNPNGTNGLGQTTSTGLAAGEYVLEVVDDNGCLYEQVFFINQPPPLAGILTVESPTYCRTQDWQSGNGLVSVTTAPDSAGVGNNTYHWYNTVDGNESNNSTFVTRTPGWMVMTIKDANDCEFIDSVYVDSLNPIADFLVTSDGFPNPSVFEGTGPALKVKFENQSQNFYQANNPHADTIFSWNLYTNDPLANNWFISTDYDENIDTIYDGEIIYEVCLIAKNFNDCADTTCKDVIVHADPFLETPNVFTPDSSPNNTFFFPSAGIRDFNCVVMNRYGVEVFKFTDINMEWDGNHQKSGNPCSDGTYFYVYGAEASNGTKYSGSGQINLIRSK